MPKLSITGERLKLSEEDLKALDQYIDDVKNKRPRPHVVDYISRLPRVTPQYDPEMIKRLQEACAATKDLIIVTPKALIKS